jgi:anaerobic selenocysteine-containing dehydrogenase
VLVYNSNPVAVTPNHHEVVRGFLRPDLFTVVHEQFFTDTTDYADVVLPATTFFEHKDLQTGYGHYFVQISDPAIEPIGEARSNFELFSALAMRMGFPEDCFRETVDAAIDATLDSGHEWVKGIDRGRLEREGHARLNLPGGSKTAFFLPFAAGNFPTPSGKAELYSEAIAAKGLDPVAAFVPPAESRHVPEARRFPLELLARKADNFLNSTFTNLPSLQVMERRESLEISLADAEPRGIRDGDTVRVFNSRGELHLRARVNGAVQPGVVAGRLDWAKLSAAGKNINVLIADRVSDLGGGPVFYSALVEVERVGPAAAR